MRFSCSVFAFSVERVDLVVQLVEHREVGVDQVVDHQVREKRGLAVRELGTLVNAVLQRLELRRRLLVNRDQVVGAHEEVMLAQDDVVVAPFGDEEDREVVVRVLVDLGPLVLVLDVLDGQRVELEDVLEQVVVGLVGGLDVQPEAGLVRLVEAFRDVLDPGGRRLPGRGEKDPHGFLIPLAAAATPRAT